jgi:hypothetical protein
MRNPNLFICKLGSINALSLRTVVINHNFTTLHHKTRNNPLEHPRAIMQVTTKFTCAESSEVFNGARYLILEKFHHNSSLGVTFQTFFSNLDVHINLDVSNIEGRHPIIDPRFLITIQSRLENLGGSLTFFLILALLGLHDLLFAVFIVLSKCFILRFELNSLSTICKRLCEISNFQISQASQVEGLL